MKALGLSPEQIEQRRKFVGGSDAGEVMTGDWGRLWRVKTGREQPEDLSDILAVQMGSFTEDLNAFWYTKQTGRPVENRGQFIAGLYMSLYSDGIGDCPFMAANLDGVTTTSKGHPAYWDAKHVGRLDEATVLRYTPQMVHCCTILGFDWWVLSVFIGNSKWELVEQEVDPIYQATLIAREREFWGYVERDEEPPEQSAPVLAPKPQPKLRTVQLEDQWRDEWPNWGTRMVELFGTFAGTYAAATAHAIAREDIKTLLPDDVGLVTRGNIKISRTRAGAVTMAITKEKTDG
jgi:predicted phage-related endonuclease